MANAQKVANIFELASLAFGKLAELTLDLKVYQAQAEQAQSSNSRWTIAEVEQLKDAISRFGADLSKIAEVLDTKTVTQIKHKIRNKAFMSDKGRRKQTFSERNEVDEPLGKKRRIEGISPPSNLIPPQSGTQTAGLLTTKQAQQMSSRMPGQPRSASGLGSVLSDYDYMQGMPQGQRPERAAGIPPRKLSMEQEAKFEGYSDSGSERYDEPDDDDDDDDEESDEERYYSEDEAFGKLAELTLDLKVYQAQAEQAQSSNSRWTIAEVEQLKDAISRFGADLSKIAEVLDTKTVTQIKHKIRNKAFMSDKGRRKQTFSERNEVDEPLGKKRRIEGISPPSNLIPPQSGTQTAGLLTTKQAQQMSSRMPGQPRSASGLGSVLSDYDYMQGMPQGQRPERAAGIPPRKLSMEQEAKFEGYSDSGSERYDEPDDDDDDDDEESDEERYYSEDEGGR